MNVLNLSLSTTHMNLNFQEISENGEMPVFIDGASVYFSSRPEYIKKLRGVKMVIGYVKR